MTIVAEVGADGVVVGEGVGVKVGVAVGVGDAEAVGDGVAESVGDGVVEPVTDGAGDVTAPAGVSEVTKAPETAVAAVSAVIRAMRRHSPVPTRPSTSRNTCGRPSIRPESCRPEHGVSGASGQGG